MNSTPKLAAAALGGAVALAFGAYALGTQTDDGSAIAGSQASGTSTTPAAMGAPPRGAPFGLDTLAQRLGVDPDKLRTALEDIRSEQRPPSDRHEKLAAALG